MAEVFRYKTAIKRTSLSSPLGMLFKEHHLVENDKQTVFDYGCGRCDDVGFLAAKGVKAIGWDPFFHPDVKKAKADIVNLGFILNVIEIPAERVEVLKDAWSFAKRLMVVGVIRPQPIGKAKPFGDGILTSNKTFQHFYENNELRDLLKEHCSGGLVEKAGDRLFIVWRKSEAPPWVKEKA